MKSLYIFCVSAFFLFFTFDVCQGSKIPSFLPDYYSPVFEDLELKREIGEKTLVQFDYISKDQSLNLNIEIIKGDRPKIVSIMRNIIINLNEAIQSNVGRFKLVGNNEIYAEINEKQDDKFVYASVLPGIIHIWTYTMSNKQKYIVDSKVDLIRFLTDKQRYELALSSGNVSMGLWGKEIYDYANVLFEKGDNEEGLNVLSRLISTSPSHYNAHLDYAKKTKDKEKSLHSLRVVLQNAEDLNLINDAASALGVKKATIDSIPLLGENERGLQLILIPLEPCNPWLLEEVAKKYTEITDVPVKIRRLKTGWEWNEPDRIFGERVAQEVLVEKLGPDIDFKGWDKKKYIVELLKLKSSVDSLSGFQIEEFIKKIKDEKGQYLADTYLKLFSDGLKKYRSKDTRTMYVGITENSIYSGDSNYVFNLGYKRGRSRSSILSYSMMLSRASSDKYQSRKRLIERIAKELVPASLKQLGIPRSSDPSCPHSYSNSVKRVDEKSLLLSEPVKEELKLFSQ